MNIPLDNILAAMIDQNDGDIFLGQEYVVKEYGGKAIAITHDPLRDGWSLTLVDEKDVTYDDGE